MSYPRGSGSYESPPPYSSRPPSSGGPPVMAQRPSIEQLEAKAREEVSKYNRYSSVELLLDTANASNKQVPFQISLKRPDQAFVEWTKCETVLGVFQLHSSFPYLGPTDSNRYQEILKEHTKQKPMIQAVRDMVRKEHTEAQNGPRPASRDYTPSPGQPSSRYAPPSNQSYGESSRSWISDQTSYPPRSDSRTSISGASQGSSKAPESDPFVTRFSQLRTSSGSGRLPYPVSPNDQLFLDAQRRSSGSVNSSVDLPASLTPRRQDTKPAGPRDMPKDTYLSAQSGGHRPNGSISGSLPRAPSPVYNPARNMQAPESIPPPRSTVRSAVPTSSRPSATGPPIPPKRALPSQTAVDAETLYRYMKEGYQIFILDVRPREHYDDGHIFAKAIACIDPLKLKHGKSYEELKEDQVYSPETETRALDRIQDFDLVVYHDQSTPNDQFLNGPVKSSNNPYLRALYSTLTDFNQNSRLQSKPILLAGGLDAWVDLVGRQSLQSSNTLNIPVSRPMPKPPRRPMHRPSVSETNTSREIRRRRLEDYKPLNLEEEREWQEKAKQEQIALSELPQLQAPADGEAPNGNDFDAVRGYDDFFRRFPPVEQQSMTMPPRVPPRKPAPQPQAPPAPTAPIPPSRPAPAVSRPSYGGVSDRAAPPQPAGAQQANATPLYMPRFIPQSLKLPRTGLKNMGNTCYMNSMIQCLLATFPLSMFFLNDAWREHVQKNPRGTGGILPEMFSGLIRAMWRQSDAYLLPTSLLKFCGRLDRRWTSGEQQDAAEFFGFLIDTLHEDLNSRHMKGALKALTEEQERVRESMPIAKVSQTEWERWSHRELSPLSALFAGQHASRVRCLACGATSTTYETFYSIDLQVPEGRSAPVSIMQCLAEYTKEEKLPADGWTCPRCKVARPAVKQIRLTRMPRVLVVCFKRFTFDLRRINSVVDFPLHGLDMQPFVQSAYSAQQQPNGPHPQQGNPDLAAVTPPFLYDLYGVCRHIGNTISSGHYTAVTKDRFRGTWVLFDDTRVRDFDPNSDRLQSKEAYVVFYERARPR